MLKVRDLVATGNIWWETCVTEIKSFQTCEIFTATSWILLWSKQSEGKCF